MKYIKDYDLGAGNWNGGSVYDEYNNQIGYIFYNGKYWTLYCTNQKIE